jgi:glucosamine-6-phosphate deaminase
VTLQLFEHPAGVASALAADLLNRIHQKPAVTLGFATGRTPMLLYRELRRRTAQGHVDWSQVHTFNLDEFVSTGDAGARYRAFMRDELFDHVNARPEHVHLLDGRAQDLARECDRYERAIAESGGIDIQLLGLGVNGHIGFNEPAEVLQGRTHVAELELPTRERNAWLFDGDVSKVPDRALTMGMTTIFHGRSIVMLVTGGEKAAALQAMIEGPITSRCPASLLQLHPDVKVMADRDAAARLSRR